MANPVKYRKIRAEATIQGLGDMDIIGMSIAFPYNDIPSGVLNLAVGRDVVSGKTAHLHEVSNQLTEQLPVAVDLLVNGVKKKIFIGYTWGPNWQRNHTSAGFSLQIVHWMDDLRSTSAYSTLFMPNTPGDYIGPAVFESTKSNGAMTPGAAGLDYANFMFDDVWNGCLKALLKLTEEQQLTGLGADAIGEGIGPTSVDVQDNTIAQKALSKFEGKLKPIFDSINITHSMSELLGNVAFGDQGGLTVWSKLQTLGALFAFGVVPSVEKAEVVASVPFMPSTKITKEIGADEYDFIKMGQVTARSLKGHVLLGSFGTVTNSLDSQAVVSGVVGEYRVKKAGMVEITAAPPWFSDLSVASEVTTETTGVSESDGVREHGETPGNESEGKSVNKRTTETREKLLGTSMAKWKFLSSVYRSRRARITGKLRTDIGPGSVVAIVLPGDKAGLYGTKKLYAFVEKVTIDVSSVRSIANTSFDLSFVRTEADDPMASLTHPLYGDPYLSGELTA